MNRNRTCYTMPAAFFVLVLVACGAGDRGAAGEGSTAGDRAGAEEGSAMDALAGGAVVVHNTMEGAWDEGEGWRIVPDWRIGDLNGSGPTVFGRITDLAVDPLGRVWVLDSQANEIRVFDEEGRHVRTIGGEGGGPGELARPSGLAFGPDGRLWVIDPGNARYTVFDTVGRLVATHRRPLNFASFPWRGGITDAGRIYEVGIDRSRSYGRFRFGYLLVAVQPGSGVTDTVRLPYYEDARYVTRNPAGQVSSQASVPFAPRLNWYFDDRGYLWFGVNDHYRIVQRTLEGDTVLITERASQRLPVTDAQRNRAIERLESFMERGGEVDLSRIPDLMPAYHTFSIDSEGYVWVQPVIPRPDADAPRTAAYDVFNPSGQFLGRIRSDVGIPLGSPATVIRGNVIYSPDFGRMGLPVPGVARARIVGREYNR